MQSASGGSRPPDGRDWPSRSIELSADHRWPLGIAIGLALVVLVNLVFIYVAVSNADQVVPSYQTEAR